MSVVICQYHFFPLLIFTTMTVNSQLILILSAFGAMNGFFVALYLLRLKPKK
jgi:hypothetical protein